MVFCFVRWCVYDSVICSVYDFFFRMIGSLLGKSRMGAMASFFIQNYVLKYIQCLSEKRLCIVPRACPVCNLSKKKV